jgi:hypothetical protein
MSAPQHYTDVARELPRHRLPQWMDAYQVRWTEPDGEHLCEVYASGPERAFEVAELVADKRQRVTGVRPEFTVTPIGQVAS